VGMLAAGFATLPAAEAQAGPPRLAAPSGCAADPTCALGLERVYGIRPVLLTGGLSALDDGRADIVLTSSIDPGLSRPDITALRDDRGLLEPAPAPFTTRATGELRARLAAASRPLTTLALRGLNERVQDGERPAAAGADLADGNGLGGADPSGPRVTVGGDTALAHYYAQALRGDGYRATVGRHATVTARAPARPVFAIKRAAGIRTLSAFARHWGRTAHAAADPLEDEQWAVSEHSVLDLPGAWQLTQGAGTVVAVVDSGTRLDHPDLAPNIWTNFNEIPGNGVDDDGNGYVDDVHGVDLTSTSRTQNLNDGDGHGTHVAGIIAAAANGRGVVGVAPKAKIMTVRVLDDQGAGTTGGVAEGIRYAAANGARVINASLQGDTPDPRLNDAVAAAAAANALVVVSAGNGGRDIDQRPSYPASIPAPNLISVAATGPLTGKTLDSYSNYGRLTVGLAAPGGMILSTTNDGGYGQKSGTSMAAPMVAGVAALMVASNPSISATDLRSQLLQRAGRASLPVAGGYVDALDAVLSSATAVGYDTTQPPQIKVLRATTQRKRTQLQVAVLGSTQAIRSYRVTLDRRRRSTVRARRAVFSVTVRRAAKRVRIDALDGRGKRITSTTKPVRKQRAGKRGVKTGHGVGT